MTDNDTNTKNDFIWRSTECLTEMLEALNELSHDPLEVRKLVDAYRHIFKLQQNALESREAEQEEAFVSAFLDWKSGRMQSAVEPVKPTEDQIKTFREYVKKWFTLDSELKDLKLLCREKSSVKNKLRDTIMAFMQTHNVEELRTSDGKLRFETRSVTKAMTKTDIQKSVESLLADLPDLAAEFSRKLKTQEKIEKNSLKRLP